MSENLKKGCELSSVYRLWPALKPNPEDCKNLLQLWREARNKRQFGQARQIAYDYWMAKTSENSKRTSKNRQMSQALER